MNFKKLNGLVPAIIQDASTGKVLMLGFMNEEALEKTRREGRVCFFSRTKNRLWTKGEESGNFLNVKDIIEDCDQDTLLVKVSPEGPVCHTGSDTCFNEANGPGTAFLDVLQDLVSRRKAEMPEGSYTAGLLQGGISRIAQKVGEEAVELVIEAMDGNDPLFLNEAADLVYHLIVLLTARGYTLGDVTAILEERHRG
jgi:phosphoribosyl-ATP pyrophosphohydrolase/phosphoribosyl-AMP cyclohydrolase